MADNQTPLAPTILKKPYIEPPTRTTSVDLEAWNSSRIRQFDVETGLTPPFPHGARVTDGTVIRGNRSVASIDDIYFEPTFISKDFQTALRLLKEGVRLINLALDDYRAERYLESDERIHHLQQMLPELFCCRKLGEGFESIINSVQNALLNNRGQMLNEAQLLALREILSLIRNEPFMNFERAIDYVMTFEEQDFNVDPVGFELLTEIIDEL